MPFIIEGIVAGLVGTFVMTLCLLLIHKSGWANADMVRAIGSAITRSYQNAFPVGLVVHFLVGIPIALAYLTLLNIFQVQGYWSTIMAAGFLGFGHGLVFSFLLLALAEMHPMERFQQVDLQVAFAHLLAHVIYGLGVGVVAVNV
ncbi:MAG: hypothetical protein GXO78_04015 [Calditrichaeota bacterium]|nr:hypothetical protein [Calditrichota bacterium]